MANKWVVKEIQYIDGDNAGASADAKTPKWWKKAEIPQYSDFEQRYLDMTRQDYIDAGYKNKPWDAYFYSPEWVKTGVRYNWVIDQFTWEWPDVTLQAQENRRKKRIEQAELELKTAWADLRNLQYNWWETAGSTVPQNAQNATQNQNGTSVSNGNTNTRKYDWTDGNGNITVWPQNANLNYYQYWDDSNPNQQWQKGWMNAKYTGEWVSNSYIEYNPDITLADLDPNYLYWENARQQNRKEAWYIARRNDMIASALYNEWKVSKEEVAEFLSQQNEWMNSTEADRLNTIESVWKRLWQIQPEQPEVDLSKAEDIVKDTSGKIYWKATAEEWNPKEWIDTLADANSVFKWMQEAQVRRVQEFVSLNPEDVATCIVNGYSTRSEQTWRDAQKYYPEFISLVNEEVKKQRWQQNITNISMWGKMDVTNQLTASENNVTTSMNTYVNKTASGSWAWTLATNLNNALADSEIVSGAREQMEVYKRKIVEIQQAAEDLPALAQQSFKWDVPQYMVNAFINNRMQQLNKELQKYQNLYNASLDEAKLEIAQTQWREEMNYKWANLQADQNYRNANLELSQKELEYNKQKAAISNWQWNDDGTYSYVDLDWVMHTLTAEEAKKALNDNLYNYATEYIDTWSKKIETAKANWQKLYWWQCEQFTDNFARQYFWNEMRWKNWWVTTAEEKAAYATEALPQRWFIAVWNYWENAKVSDAAKKYWHTWIVIDYDQKTWTFTTIESNVDWQWHVEIRTHSINDAELQGFRDPSQWENAKNGGWSWNVKDEYLNLPNGMLDVFIDAENSSATWDERKYVKQWREAYWILNEMLNNWEIDAMMNWDEMASAVESFTKYLMQNAANRTIVDEDGNFVLDTVIQSFLNSWQTLSSQERDALAHLYRLVQIKLRRDSWAAINIWEWMTDFGMYLPQIWLSSRQKMQRLFDLERAAIESALPWNYVKQYVPLITKDMVNAQSDEVIKDKAYENAINLNNQ